jgi:hypothetical protein
VNVDATNLSLCRHRRYVTPSSGLARGTLIERRGYASGRNSDTVQHGQWPTDVYMIVALTG